LGKELSFGHTGGILKVIAISGSGIGAGKSTLASQVGDEVWSLAGALRSELIAMYPTYPWMSKKQSDKESIRITERDNKNMRTVMIEHGQLRCKEDPDYWAKILGARFNGLKSIASGTRTIAIDDIRKVNEVLLLRQSMGPHFIHIHVIGPNSIPEKEFQNDELAELADYKMTWTRGSAVT